MRTTPARRGVATSVLALVVLALVVLAGCSAAGDSGPGTSSTPSPTPSPAISVPADAVSLAALGFVNGPVDRVFVPAGAQVSAQVDQTNNVTLVLTAPSATELATFYRRTATGNGFTVTADDQATSTLTFAGFGWTGTFTGDTRASALLLRPAP